jgi:hypothetical protein
MNMKAMMNSGLCLLVVLAATMTVEFVQSQAPPGAFVCELW